MTFFTIKINYGIILLVRAFIDFGLSTLSSLMHGSVNACTNFWFASLLP